MLLCHSVLWSHLKIWDCAHDFWMGTQTWNSWCHGVLMAICQTVWWWSPWRKVKAAFQLRLPRVNQSRTLKLHSVTYEKCPLVVAGAEKITILLILLSWNCIHLFPVRGLQCDFCTFLYSAQLQGLWISGVGLFPSLCQWQLNSVFPLEVIQQNTLALNGPAT